MVIFFYLANYQLNMNIGMKMSELETILNAVSS